MGGICDIYKELKLIFVCFLPHYVLLSPEHWFSTTSALSSHFSQLKNLRTLSPLNKESGKLEGKVSKCRFCCLLQISAPHLVFFWALCIGGQTNYGGAISGHTFPTSRLSGRTPSPSSAPIAFLELAEDEEWPQ